LNEFDFDLKFDTNEFGIASNNLTYEGRGYYKGMEFIFNGPINDISGEYMLVKEGKTL